MIDASECGKRKGDGQKVAASNTEVRDYSSGVKCIRAGAIWLRRKEKMGGRGEREGGSKWLKGKREKREGGREDESMGDAATVRLKP